MNCIWTSLCIGLVLLAAGCTSTLTGTKLNPDGTVVSGELKGIPYQLPRPRFTISKVEADSSGSAKGYEINMEYEPDPDQRYAINIDPAMLTDIEFELNFDELGQVASTTSDTTELLMPTVTAVGEFFVSSLSSVAKIAGAADIKRVSDKPPFQQVTLALKKKVDEKKIWNEMNKAFENANKATVSEGQALADRIITFKTPEAFLGGFHYRDKTERRWLITAKHVLLDDVAREPVKEVEGALKDYKETLSLDEQLKDGLRFFAEKLNSREELNKHAAFWKSVGAQKTKLLLVTSWELDLYMNYLAFLKDSITESAYEQVRKDYASMCTNGTLADKLKDAKTEKKVYEIWDDQVKDNEMNNAQKKLVDSLTRAFDLRERTAKAIAMLDTVIDMPWKTWSYRHVLYLEEQINTLVQKSLMDNAVDVSVDVAKLRKQRAAALGVLNEFERAKSLRAFLSKPRDRQETNEAGKTLTAPALDAYAIGRAELDALEKKILDARLAMVPTEKSKVEDEDGGEKNDKGSGNLPGVYPWITCSAGEKVTPEWIKTKLTNEKLGSPDFVIVLERTPPRKAEGAAKEKNASAHLLGKMDDSASQNKETK